MKKRERRAYSREERKHMILLAMSHDRAVFGEHSFMTAAEIAHSLDVTPSTRLRQIIDELCNEGYVKKERFSSVNIAGYKWLYSLTATATHEKRMRKISLNGRLVEFS